MSFPIRQVKWSLFLKLTLVFFVTAFALVLLVADFSGLLRQQRLTVHDVFRKNFAFYLNQLADQIGDPPDLARARELSARLDLGISIDGPGAHWSSSPALPSINHCEEKGRKGFENVQIWNPAPYRFYYVVHRGEESFLFSLSGAMPPAFPPSRVARLLLLIVLVLFLTYLMVSFMLNPLSPLLQGVEQVARGNLEYRIELKGQGEFGRIADSFNQMAQKVRDMLDARERLTLDVSHELRSPLTRMKLALEMIPDTKRRETMTRAVREMEMMLSEILEGQKLKNPHGGLAKTRLNLAALVRRVAADHRREKPGLKVKGPRVLWASADGERMATALRNVVENALKYSAHQKAPVRVEMGRREGWVAVTVRDHGIGIPLEEQKFVFEPFYRVDKSRARETGGYGLGLSLCRQIMEAHGGRIALESDGRAGTAVTLQLPEGGA